VYPVYAIEAGDQNGDHKGNVKILSSWYKCKVKISPISLINMAH